MRKNTSERCGERPTTGRFDKLLIRPAEAGEAGTVATMLNEGVGWLRKQDEILWRSNMLEADSIAKELDKRLYWLAFADEEPAGAVKIHLGASTLSSPRIDRLAIRRGFFGRGLPVALLRWASELAFDRRRQYLYLNTGASCPRLRKICEQFGFKPHADGPADELNSSHYQLQLY